jgi:signal transduction histidine kinase/DNA-binding response OmpR family regulator
VKDKANILLVDDRPDKQVVYRAILEELGQNLIVAMSGEQALKQLLKSDFAVILLDVNMPGLNGLETAALIRGRKRSAHVPIIFITADYGDEERMAKGYALGAVDFMVSPIVPEVLRTKVKVFVDLFLLAQQAKMQAKERIALAEERAARAAAERASQRSAFLARASVALSGSLNFSETRCELVRLAIPFLADVSALTLPGGEPIWARTEVAWLSGDELQSPLATSFVAAECGGWFEAIERVMATGVGESFSMGAEGGPRAAGRDISQWPHVEIPPGAKIRSLLLLPLVARAHTVGVLSLGFGPSERSYDPELISIASDFAGRAAIALDNALLYKELRDHDRRKDEFLAILSHELRNPLAPIANAVHVLSADTGDGTQLKWAKQVLERQVHQLRRLVDDLLDVSRITHGKIELQMQPLDVASVVAVAVETAKPFIDARQHMLEVRLPAQPMQVKGDPVRLAQILANLLNNAAKYTDRNGRIALTAVREGNEVVFNVRDSGIGICADALTAIFEPFRQLGNASDRVQGGLGVGLTLVKRFVAMHDGTIEARSGGPGQGSEFIVRLPLLAEAATTNAMTQLRTQPTTQLTAESESAAPSAKRRRILVADDNVDLAASMGLLLELMGNEVRVTHDGLTAVAMEAEFRPDIVFLDIGMAKMNGFDACRRIREKPWGKEPVIVALTGWGHADDKRRSREAGFDHHLVKPLDPALLERFLAEIEIKVA